MDRHNMMDSGIKTWQPITTFEVKAMVWKKKILLPATREDQGGRL